VELGLLLVPEEDVWCPDEVPRAVRQLHLSLVDALVDERLEGEPLIGPALTQVHVQTVVLQYRCMPCLSVSHIILASRTCISRTSDIR